jgi:hypothetical protein
VTDLIEALQPLLKVLGGIAGVTLLYFSISYYQNRKELQRLDKLEQQVSRVERVLEATSLRTFEILCLLESVQYDMKLQGRRGAPAQETRPQRRGNHRPPTPSYQSKRRRINEVLRNV